MLRGGNDVEFGLGMCEFWDGWEGELAGEVWVDVLRPFCPYLRAFLVKTPPAYRVKKSAIFYNGRILGELGLLRQD